MTTVPGKRTADRLKAAEHGVKRVFFALFRVFLKRANGGFRGMDGRRVTRVLFLRPESKIGDLVISLPVFDALKRHFPHIKIGLVCSPRNVPLIRDDPRFESVFLYRKNLWKDIGEIRRIRREKYDCVLDLLCDDSVTSLFLSQLCAPGKPRLGVGKQRFERYYDFNRYHPVDESRHIISNTLHLLDAFGIDSAKENGHAEPFIPDDSKTRAEAFFEGLGNGGPDRLAVGLNLSAGMLNRRWPPDNYAALVRRMLNWSGSVMFVVITVPGERDQGERLCRQFPGRAALVPDRLDIVDVAAIVRHLDLLISPDTSLVHIARSFMIPVVSLYTGARKNMLLWRPYGQKTGSVIASHPDDVFDITVEQVFEAFVELVGEAKKVGR
jgi:heptosyltransferase-3